jgi:hypothetical protein
VKKNLIALLVSVLSCSPSLADPGWFVGIGAGLVSSDDGSETIEPVNLYLRGGLGINERFDVGVEATSTISDDGVGSVDYDLETTLVFFKINFDIGDSTTIYALLGSASIEITGKQGGNKLTLDDSDTAFGVGIEFWNNDSSAFVIDYISYYDDDEFDGVASDLTVESLNLGYVTYF